MKAVIVALSAAAKAMVHPIITAVMVVPMAIAAPLWLAVAWFSWDAWSPYIHGWVLDWMPEAWASGWEAAWLGTGAAWIAAALALIPLILMTSMLIATVFAMPVLLKHVAGQSFPALERRASGTFVGSLWNAVAAVFVFLALWVVTLPLWLIPPLAVVLPLLLSAHLNQRLFRYDALSEHASAAEMRQLVSSARGRLFLLGIFTGLLYFVPVLNLVAPVYAAIAFIYLCLSELRQLRQASPDASGVAGAPGQKP